MPVEFLIKPGSGRSSQPRSSYSRSREDYEQQKGRGGGFFLWTILIVLLIAMNAGVWTFSLIVFGYPEKPFNYRFLTRLNKLEPIVAFPALGVPKGKFHGPQQLYEAYYAHSPQHLRAVNSVLLRDYIRNYSTTDTTKTAIYVRGTFRIYQVKELTESDLFTSGIVLRAICQEYPQVVIEFVMPADAVPEKHFEIGDDLTIDVEGSSVFAALLNVEKLRDYKICFTLVPLVYGSYPIEDGKSLKLSPPKVLNMAGPLPITDEAIGELPVTAGTESP